MKLKNCISILISISFLLFIFSCKKNFDTQIPPGQPSDSSKPNLPSDTTNPSPPNVDSLKDLNKWECEVDGIQYGGSIDTSFFKISDPGTNFADTVIECSGTTFDKKSNIYFSVPINRTQRTNVFSSAFLGSTTVFDTSSVNYLFQSRDHSGSVMNYVVDSFKSNRLLISFNGKLISGVSDVHTVNNGKISCYLRTGNAEPKKFKFQNDQANYFGSATSAEIISNTMVINFLPFVFKANNRFRLSIRTGGTIKPGIYDSKNGDVSLEYYVPSIYWFYTDDAFGDIRVVIHSVNQNIVHGSFSGTSSNGKSISGGEFTVRVKRYLPETDSEHQWKFVSDEGLTTYNYQSSLNLFGGNIVKATLSSNSFKHLLTVEGESDQGSSAFKLVISSFDPIKTGVYETGIDVADKLDSLKYNSDQKIWNGYSTELFSDWGKKTYCKIDSIDGQKVVGSFWGSINRRTSPNSLRVGVVRKGFFKAKF